MVAPPSLESIQAAYENVKLDCIFISDGIARIRDKGSDGDERRLPPTGEPLVLWDNTINALQEADGETVDHWLRKIGDYLVHEGMKSWPNLSTQRAYTLKRFPKGYKLYTRSTGHKDNPRKDSYLYGSTTDRCREFRSPEEFVFHVKWMAFGKPRDELGRPLCFCCYCSKRTQGEITPLLKEKVSHLNSHSSASGRSSGHRNTDSTTQAPSAPVMAKDYTHLNQGEGVSRFVLENFGTVPPSDDQ